MTDKVLKYKGFLGSIEIDVKADLLYGKILHINDLIDYNADTAAELEQEFKNAVDDYLELCQELGEEPQKSASGTFNVRITPELHARLIQSAAAKGETLNAYIKNALETHLEPKQTEIHHYYGSSESVITMQDLPEVSTYSTLFPLTTNKIHQPKLRVQ